MSISNDSLDPFIADVSERDIFASILMNNFKQFLRYDMMSFRWLRTNEYTSAGDGYSKNQFRIGEENQYSNTHSA